MRIRLTPARGMMKMDIGHDVTADIKTIRGIRGITWVISGILGRSVCFLFATDALDERRTMKSMAF